MFSFALGAVAMLAFAVFVPSVFKKMVDGINSLISRAKDEPKESEENDDFSVK